MSKLMSKMIAIGLAAGEVVYLNLRLFLRTRMLVTANAGGGKSYFLRLLAELLFPHVQVIIIDPEGEYFTLREKFGYALISHMPGSDSQPHILSAALLAHRLLEHKISAVCDISELKAPVRHTWIRLFLESLMEAPRHLRRRVVIIVDEAHLYCPEKGFGESEASSAMLDIATRGRKRGYTAVFASQRHAKVAKSATAELLNRMVGPTFEGADIERAFADLSIPKDEKHAFAEQVKLLDEGNFNCIGRAISKKRILFKVNKVKTTHPDPDDLDKAHVMEPPPAPQQVRALLAKLADLPQQAEQKAKTEAELKKEIAALKQRADVAERSLAIEKKRLAPPAPRPLPAAKPLPAPKPLIETKIEVEQVDVPVVTEKVMKRLEAMLKRGEKLVERVSQFGKPIDDAAKELRASIGQVLSVDSAAIFEFKSRKLMERQGRAVRPMPPAPPVHKPVPAKAVAVPKPQKPSKPEPVREAAPAAGGGSGEEQVLTGRQKEILKSLVQFEALGITEVPRTWLTGWMGIKVTGTFMNNLGGLRTMGYVDYIGAEKAKITDSGRMVAPTSDEEITTEGLLKHCKDAVNGRQQEMLDYLHQRPGQWVSREELAEAYNLKVTGTFMNNLGGLHNAGMVDYGERKTEEEGKVKIADWLFVNAMAT